MKNYFILKVKYLVSFIILCISSSLFVTSCSNNYYEKRVTETPRPYWVDNPTARIYIGISHKFPDEADARADAINDAKRQIILMKRTILVMKGIKNQWIWLFKGEYFWR